MAEEKRKPVSRSFDLCKLVKEQLGPDIKYGMAMSRRTNKEHGFEVCELPKTKQWVPGKRTLGGREAVLIPECASLTVDGKPLKTVGSIHTHPFDKKDSNALKEHVLSGRPSLGDLEVQKETGEQFTCVAVPKTGMMNCFSETSKKDLRKLEQINEQVSDEKTYHDQANPIVDKYFQCETQVEKVGRFKRIKEKIRKPKRPPLRI